MANRVVISICGEEYTFVAEETSAYMQKVGSYVSEKMAEVLGSAKVGRTDAAVLTAANIADELFKSQAVAEQLRAQIKEYLDQATKAYHARYQYTCTPRRTTTQKKLQCVL